MASIGIGYGLDIRPVCDIMVPNPQTALP